MKRAADNFAVSLWGELLYGNPNFHEGGAVLSLSDKIMDLAVSPWSNLWHAIQRLLGLVAADEPTKSEAKVRADLAGLAEENMAILETHELHHPKAPPKTIRNLSLNSGGGRYGPLSDFAYELTHLNVFGS